MHKRRRFSNKLRWDHTQCMGTKSFKYTNWQSLTYLFYTFTTEASNYFPSFYWWCETV